MNFDFAAVFGKTPEEVLKHFGARELLETGSWREVWQDAHARSFTVANVMKRDVLEDLHAAVRDVVTTGKSRAEVQRELIAKLKTKGWWSETSKGIVGNADGEFIGKKLNARRLQTIFDTNMAQSYHAANYQKQTALIDLKPWRRYNHHPHTHPRASHAALNGMLFRQDDVFWDTHMPQNGWGCHCDTTIHSERDIAREGWDDKKRTGAGNMRTDEGKPDARGNRQIQTTYTDPKTGVEVKPDAAFNYNVGRAPFQPDLRSTAPTLARQYVQTSLRGPDFKRFYSKASQTVRDNPNKPLAELRRLSGGEQQTVAILSSEFAQVLGAKTQSVLLSDETLIKQAVNRDGQDMALSDYWRVQEVLDGAQVVVESGTLHLSFYLQDGVWFSAVVKTTQDGSELYLQSYRRSSLKDVNRSVKNNKVLFDRRGQ